MSIFETIVAAVVADLFVRILCAALDADFLLLVKRGPRDRA